MNKTFDCIVFEGYFLDIIFNWFYEGGGKIKRDRKEMFRKGFKKIILFRNFWG